MFVSLVDGERAIVILHVDIDVHAVEWDTALAVLLNSFQDHILVVVAIAALVVSQHISWFQSRSTDDGGVRLDEVLHGVTCDHDAVEAVEPGSHANSILVLDTDINTDVRVVVDEGGELRSVSRVRVHFNPERLRVVERLPVIQRPFTIDILVSHVVKV